MVREGEKQRTRTPLFGDDHRQTEMDAMTDSFILQSDERVEELSNQVSAIKEISLQIHDEAQQSNQLLQGIGGQLESARTSVKQAIRRISEVTKSASSRHMIYLVLFLVAVLLVLYRLF
jgi:blocked-early-in-transport protein 1